MLCFFFVFFFKQKTAYEMRISDWSSDVCSSDLVKPCYAVDKTVDLSHAGVALFQMSFQDLVDILRDLRNQLIVLILRKDNQDIRGLGKIGRASCRERVCQYV